MQKTFSLENMETYFKNYIPCDQHIREPITNFCTERVCLKFLCPECVQNHSTLHANHTIYSIKTCIKQTSEKIRDTVNDLEAQISRNAFLRPENTQEYTKQLIKQLEEVKKGLIQEINSYFRDKQNQIRKQTSKYSTIQKKLESLKKQLAQATGELSMLEKHLFYANETRKAIKKANSIDYKNMVRHFKNKIDQLQKQMNFNVKLQMNNQRREQFRTSLNALIGIKNKTLEQSNLYKNKKYMQNHSKQHQNIYKPLVKSNQFNHNDHLINPPPLSADRILGQNSFRIDTANYFEHEPFLHFFEMSKSNLHILRINSIKESEPIKWQVIPLNISFDIPSFHRTIATENGNIYIIGGTIAETMKKSKTIYQFDPLNKTLIQAGELIIPRSSHSIVCHRKIIYIIGGMTENDENLKKGEIFNPQTNQIKMIAPCKYATTNSCLCYIGKQTLIKLGGVFATGESNDHIEIYNIVANFWGEVDPTIENVKGEFGLLSCSGWAPLNQNQVFIFGGYNQQADSQNSKMSFVLEQNKQDNEYYIKYVNLKNPPIAQGFWNPQGIVHNGIIYSLQNVDGEQQNDCLEDKRNLLIFNGKTWSTCYTS